jgi:hypothetical protein
MAALTCGMTFSAISSIERRARSEEHTSELQSLREITGDFGTLLYAGHDWVDPVLARRSMELMAEKVMPQVNAAIAKAA